MLWHNSNLKSDKSSFYDILVLGGDWCLWLLALGEFQMAIVVSKGGVVSEPLTCFCKVPQSNVWACSVISRTSDWVPQLKGGRLYSKGSWRKGGPLTHPEFLRVANKASWGEWTPQALNFMNVFKCWHLIIHSIIDNLVSMCDQIPCASWSLWLLSPMATEIPPRFLMVEADLHRTLYKRDNRLSAPWMLV